MLITDFIGFAAIPLAGLCIAKLRSLSEAGPEALLKRVILKPMFSAFFLACCAAIQSLVTNAGWLAYPLLGGVRAGTVIGLSCAIGGMILFALAMAVEAKNQGNLYTVKNRFLKYSLQSGAAALLLWAACLIVMATTNNIDSSASTAMAFAHRYASLISTAIAAYSGSELIKAIRNAVWIFTGKELPKNSNDMKALRKSPNA